MGFCTIDVYSKSYVFAVMWGSLALMTLAFFIIGEIKNYINKKL